jgi:hypothetical protein
MSVGCGASITRKGCDYSATGICAVARLVEQGCVNLTRAHTRGTAVVCPWWLLRPDLAVDLVSTGGL